MGPHDKKPSQHQLADDPGLTPQTSRDEEVEDGDMATPKADRDYPEDEAP